MNIDGIMRELAQYTRLMEETAAVVESLKDQLKQYMNSNHLETLIGSEHKASYKAVSSSRIDTAALRKAYPEAAAECTRTTEAMRFTFV